MGELTIETVRSLLREVDEATVHDPRGAEVAFEWCGAAMRASVRGSNLGRLALVFDARLGPHIEVVSQVPLVKLLEHVASNATVRLALLGDDLAFETSIVWGEIEPARMIAVVRGRLSELCAVATAWRARLAPADETPPSALGKTLDVLKRTVCPPPDVALVVAAVAFGVAGADGNISEAERERLRAWLREVPAFASMDYAKLSNAIAYLADDPGRALIEASHKLDVTARLLAWGLANEMAHADGFASDDERRYLGSVATAFKLAPETIAPLAAETQGRAVARETREPPPPSR